MLGKRTRNNIPVGVCVKVSSIRPAYNNLKEWTQDVDNCLVTRNGRVFITKQEVFHYPNSPWANPFRLKDYSVEESLELYKNHLDKLLKNEKMLDEFKLLSTKKRIGCFCAPGALCHRNIILQKLKEIFDEKVEEEPNVKQKKLSEVPCRD